MPTIAASVSEPQTGPASAAPLASSPLTSSPPLPLQLLLAQAVCELGTAAGWLALSERVESSPEWPDNAAKMTQQGYESAFNDMMGVRGLDISTCAQPKARSVRKLLHSLYSELLTSLRDHILLSHSHELKLRSEIQQITSGEVDNVLFDSASQPIKDKLLESQRGQTGTGLEGECQEDHEQAGTPAKLSPPAGATLRTVTVDDKRPATEQLEFQASPRDEEQPEQEMVSTGGISEAVAHEEDTLGKELPSNTTMQVDQQAQEAPEQFETVDERERIEPAFSSKKQARKSPQAETEIDDHEQGVDGQADRADGVSDEKDVELDEGVIAEEEAEQDDSGTSNSRKKGPAARKGSRSTKRKAAEQSSLDTVAPTGVDVTDEVLQANKRSKRGGRKSRAETDADTDGPPDPNETKELKQTTARRKTAYTRILETIRTSLPFSSSFDTKVTKSQAPNYSAAVQRPTCLRDIGKKIKNGEIKDNGELMREFAVMCANAVQFNGVELGEISIGRQAQELWEAFEKEMNETLSTEFLVDSNSTT